jgi:hypothetical protein
VEMAIGSRRLGFKSSATNFIFKHPRLAARLAEIAGKPIVLFNRALPELFPHKLLVLNWRRQQPLFD